jgi:hypothetical protein
MDGVKVERDDRRSARVTTPSTSIVLGHHALKQPQLPQREQLT